MGSQKEGFFALKDSAYYDIETHSLLEPQGVNNSVRLKRIKDIFGAVKAVKAHLPEVKPHTCKPVSAIKKSFLPENTAINTIKKAIRIPIIMPQSINNFAFAPVSIFNHMNNS